ncbi:MAG: metallophosphatase family protein [Desulfarculus sp.]|nr:metallophosphatase family protein [Pseudomonadota bacterium]MBV1715285.1 metallophosphatase family protein [Desulfarculus sp.]MBU4575349.1 metallophosphatase family protein [Pseudomonadota bacterium]MBU4597892.1 metallophosphatase family protein [Pseudomonadota bacterium]MBV1737939.1 metallophosphatase family protein [Desulfarculus sp.]
MPCLAVLSDLHANLSALEAVKADLARRGVDQVLVLGDLVGYLARPNRVAGAVAQAGWDCLAGNYDLAVLAGGNEGVDNFLRRGIGPEPRAVFSWTERRVRQSARSFLSKLPREIEMDTPAGRLLAVHGSPLAVRQYVYPDHPEDELAAWLQEAGAAILCMGHTHIPFVRRVGHGLVVNPGSVGKAKDGDPRASYAILELSAQPSAEIVRLEWDIEAESRLLGEAGLGATAPRLAQGR